VELVSVRQLQVRQLLAPVAVVVVPLVALLGPVALVVAVTGQTRLLSLVVMELLTLAAVVAVKVTRRALVLPLGQAVPALSFSNILTLFLSKLV